MVQIRFNEHAIAWRQVDGEIVAVDLNKSEYLTVNPVGRLLWLRLAEGSDEDDLVKTLVRETGVDVDRARDDLDNFLASLRSRGLLREE